MLPDYYTGTFMAQRLLSYRSESRTASHKLQQLLKRCPPVANTCTTAASSIITGIQTRPTGSYLWPALSPLHLLPAGLQSAASTPWPASSQQLPATIFKSVPEYLSPVSGSVSQAEKFGASALHMNIKGISTSWQRTLQQQGVYLLDLKGHRRLVFLMTALSRAYIDAKHSSGTLCKAALLPSNIPKPSIQSCRCVTLYWASSRTRWSCLCTKLGSAGVNISVEMLIPKPRRSTCKFPSEVCS